MSYNINLSIKALSDLEDISNYISDYSESISKKFIEFLTNKIYTELSFMPYMYREFSKGIRIIPHKGYVILYNINEKEKTVEIITVVHGARDLNNLQILKK